MTQFFITSRPSALVTSGNNASISGNLAVVGTVSVGNVALSSNASTMTIGGNISTGSVTIGNIALTSNVTTLTIGGNISASYITGNGSGLTGISSPVTIASVAITDSSGTLLDDAALGTESYLTIQGSGFGAGAVVLLGSVAASMTNAISQSQLRARFVGVTSGTYSVFVVNTDGTSAVLASAVTWSDFPIWSTTNLAPATKTRSLSRNLAATGDSNIVYTASSTPPGTTLSASGTLSGTITEFSNTTSTYSFTVQATDAQLQNTPATFSLSTGFLKNLNGNANVVVSNSTYTGDTNHLAVSNSGGFVKFVSPSPQFLSGASVLLNNAAVSSTFVSSTEVRAEIPAATEGSSKSLEIVNVDGSTLTNANIAQWAPPAWTTASALADVKKGVAFSRTVAATHGAGAVTYAVISGSVPSGASFNTATGVISGNVSGSTDETSSLALNALAPTLQTAAREFTLLFYVELFTFTSHTFTTSSASGRIGPTLAQCRAAYNTTWDENSSYFTVNPQGVQILTLPRTGMYEIEVGGSQGGRGSNSAMFGGLGRVVRARFAMSGGAQMYIVVGQRGSKNTSDANGGGGGASHVYYPSLSVPLIIAGGGGASGGYTNTFYDSQNANYTTAGSAGTTGQLTAGGAGGTNGSGGLYGVGGVQTQPPENGVNGSGGAGGGAGSIQSYGEGVGGGGGGVGSNTSTFLGGAARDPSWQPSYTGAAGGFGGGGGGGTGNNVNGGGGGGGGYSGGGGGGVGSASASQYSGAGGGGGSYIAASGTNATDLGLNGTRDDTTTQRGYVTITFIP